MLRPENAGPVGQELNVLHSAVGWLAALGDRADGLAESFQVDARTPNWPELDAGTQESYASDLIDLLDLEEQMPPREPLWGKYLSTEAYAELHDAVAHYHCTLPFSEAERNWLFTTYRAVEQLPEEDSGFRGVVLALEKQRGEIVSTGRPQVIMGDELVRRWWAWRREADEFDGIGAYKRSQVALKGLLTLVGERE
jgi:hypothetical protein